MYSKQIPRLLRTPNLLHSPRISSLIPRTYTHFTHFHLQQSHQFHTNFRNLQQIDPIQPQQQQQQPPPLPKLKIEGPVEQILREVKEAKTKEIKESKDSKDSKDKELKPDSTPKINSSVNTNIGNGTVTVTGETEVVVSDGKKKSWWEKAKHEFHHYWTGFKLLGAEISISGRLLSKLLKGEKLTRREQRQLRRTTGDIFRLVPLIIILLVPFLEFALPFLLYLFPNMLPSTFESKFQKEENRKRLLKVRLEMAKFLQETVEEVSVSGTGMSVAKEFNDFFQKYRTSGEQAPTEDILNIARKFRDDDTLQNLSRPQLVSMARYMNITVFGTDTFLRHQIERQLQQLKQDDSLILQEGVDNLTMPELQNVCSSRGIRTVGVSPARLRAEVNQWLELHIKHNIPSTILLLSRAFSMSERIPTSSEEAVQRSAEALQATLTALPDQLLNEAALKVSEEEGIATYKQKLNVLQEQEELIADELEQEAIEAAKKKAKELEIKAKEKELKEQQAKEEQLAREKAEKEAAMVFADAVQKSVYTALTPDTPSQPVEEPEVESKPEEIMTDAELKKLGEALKTIASDSAVTDVKSQLDELKEEHKEYQSDITELTSVTQIPPTKSTTTLSERVTKMISKIEKELIKYDSEIGSKLNLVRPDDGGTITIEELQEALKVINDHPDDERIKKIVKALDADQDGRVALHEIMALVSQRESEGHGVVVEDKSKKSA
ncbi:hypothetical protein HK098_005628 [Nowakowskiella sp. JEL0407]|nr:hypothetical protein HK098_005628 [Nowakowskiella sp. JEL0407]